jgi:hypothetical protein
MIWSGGGVAFRPPAELPAIPGRFGLIGAELLFPNLNGLLGRTGARFVALWPEKSEAIKVSATAVEDPKNPKQCFIE